MTFDRMNIWRFTYYNNKPSLVPIGLQLFKWGHFHIFSLSYNLTWDDFWPRYTTFDHINIWRLPHYINKPSLVPNRLQLFKWDHFHILAYLTTWPQMTFDLDMWTFDLINKWGFPCCIYDPPLVEIHLSMWKVEPNVNLFSQQTTTSTDNINRQQQWTKWSLCVFPAKAGDTKASTYFQISNLKVKIGKRWFWYICGRKWISSVYCFPQTILMKLVYFFIEV